MQLPGGQACTLQIRTRLRHQHVQLLSLLDRYLNDAERCSNSARRQGSRVALRHHAAIARHELRAEAANRFVGCAFLQMHRLCFFDKRLLDPREIRRLGRKFGKPALHPV